MVIFLKSVPLTPSVTICFSTSLNSLYCTLLLQFQWEKSHLIVCQVHKNCLSFQLRVLCNLNDNESDQRSHQPMKQWKLSGIVFAKSTFLRIATKTQDLIEKKIEIKTLSMNFVCVFLYTLEQIEIDLEERFS